MTLILLSLLLILSFYVLGKVCDDYFVESLEYIADRLKLSEDIAGATLMAIGSSAPELFVSLFAVFKPGEHSSVGAGTIVGSALFNLLVIIGISALACVQKVQWQPIIRDSFFYIISILWLLYSFNDGVISSFEATVFILAYLVYLFSLKFWRNLFPYESSEEGEDGEDENENEDGDDFKVWHYVTRPIDRLMALPFRLVKNYYYIFSLSIFFIAFISYILVEVAVEIAHILSIPETIIALTILAVGTSIPDLMSSWIVAKKGKGGMAISNAIGSNIFDILIGLGLPWILIMYMEPDKILTVKTTHLNSGVMVLLISVAIMLAIFIMSKWQVGKKGGWVMILGYFSYIGYAVFHAM